MSLDAVEQSTYREVPPSRDLGDFVACGWSRVIRTRPGRPAMPVIPDGCADIIICDDRPPVLVGPDTEARWPQLADGLVITGLRLRPGALRSPLGTSALELVDQSIRLEHLGADVSALHARLLDTRGVQGRLSLLQDWVRRRVALRPADRAVIHACRHMVNSTADLSDIASRLGWSTRKFRREFVDTCGYGPKTMQRILRVQRATRVAHRTRGPLRLSALATSSGFSDQAHMTREFRAITGSTPAEFLTRAEPGLSRWLDADWPD